MRVRALCASVCVLAGVLWPSPAVQPTGQADALQSIRALVERGRYAEAEPLAEAAFDAARARSADPGPAGDLFVETLVRNGRGAEARTREVAELIVRARGAAPGSPLAADGLRGLGNVLLQSGDYELAIVRFREALAARERATPPQHAEIATDLDHLALALNEVERHDEAMRHSDRALALRRRGEPELARTLQVRGLIWRNKGNYPQARAHFERAVSLREATHPGHPELAVALTLLGDQLVIEGALARGKQVLDRAVTLADATLRPDHPQLASSLRSHALALQELGDLPSARVQRERALGIAERSLGTDNPKFAVQLNDFGITLFQQGDYAGARTFLERARAIYVRRLGPDDAGATTATFNLAVLHMALGDFGEARRALQAVIESWERVYGPGHVNVARALSAMAETLAQQGLDAEARRYYERALAIRERELGRDSQSLARTLSQLSVTVARLGQAGRALDLSGRAVSIWEKSGADEGLAEALVIHAGLLANRGDLAGSKGAYERARQIRRALFGASHPLTGEAEVGLAAALFRLGNRAEAHAAALRGEEIGRNHARLTLGSLAERQALDYAARRPRGLDLAISLVPDLHRATPVLEALILGRALTLDEIASRQRSLADSPELAPMWEELAITRRRLANLVIAGARQQTAAQHAALVDEARRAKEQAERALALRSATFRSQLARSDIGLDQVRAALPRDSALVSFVRFDRSIQTPGSTGTGAAPAPDASPRNPPPVPSYAAFVLRPDEREPTLVALGSADVIEPLIERWRSDMVADVVRRAPATVRPAGTLLTSGVQLRQRIWDPIAPHLAGAARLFVVPDGALNLIPLAALPVDESRYLVEDGPTIHYLSAERDLVPVEKAPDSAARGLLAIGGPAFSDTTVFAASGKTGTAPAAPGPDTNPAIENRARSGARAAEFRTANCSDFQSLQFRPLPGSAREAEDVVSLWRETASAGVVVTGLTGSAATESVVKRLGPESRILHFATHGFFLGEDCASALDGTRAVGGLVQIAQGTPRAGRARREEPPENPLVLSGLALAGANLRTSAGPEEEDGILTAEEVASLDLSGVEWAVLSACDTGLGHLRAGEGVFGLRRAFQVAGARTTIMSLWQVEDRAARQWIRALYEGRLQHRLDTPDALRRASLSVLRERRATGQSTNPFYWAGFVAAGDWR